MYEPIAYTYEADFHCVYGNVSGDPQMFGDASHVWERPGVWERVWRRLRTKQPKENNHAQ